MPQLDPENISNKRLKLNSAEKSKPTTKKGSGIFAPFRVRTTPSLLARVSDRGTNSATAM